MSMAITTIRIDYSTVPEGFDLSRPDAIAEVITFWRDLGVDGFRLDTINFYFHDKELRDNPALAGLSLVQRGSRLSVMPVSEAQWQAILAMR